MNESRPFRFGYQAARDLADMRGQARDAEAAGFDVISTWDHIGATISPLLPLLAMADATERIRVCPTVINNDLHHPVQLAMEFSDLDHLTGGRAELGIGAGHSFTEYEAIGIPFDPARVRKERMAESIEVIRRLLTGESVTWDGTFYHLSDVTIRPSQQARLPFFVGVNGSAALAHAAQHADTIGLTMLGKTLPDGHRHEVRWQADTLDRTVAHVQANAAGREVELNALVQIVVVTDDRRSAAEEICAELPSLSLDDALTTPFLALGTHDEIADHFRRCRTRWGISYFTVRSIDDIAPVIERLRSDR